MFLRVSACVFTTMAVLATWPSTVVAQQALPSGARSTDGLWQAGTDANVAAAQRRATTIRAYSVQRLNRPAFIALLGQAPLERTGARPGASPLVIELPLPDGRYSRFRIEESPILDPALAAAFPDIKTYRGSGVDDPTATVRFDITPNGFHAQIIAAGGTVLIDPYTEGDLVNHVAYDKGSAQRPERPVDEVLEDAAQDLPRTYNQFPITHGTTLRTYRLALAATGEYTAAAGGTKSAAVSRITTTMNRVNGIYEREVAVRLTVATGTPSDATALIYTSPTTDPYTNNDGAAMLAQNQSTVDSIVGSANYDIGHVFSTGGGGIAGLGVVCNGFGWKARGVTGLPNPTGDVFAVDYVSHEMGHQFGANHTFNSPSGSCGGNRSTAHAYEVGSGSTIMGYSGICSPENTQINSTDIFTVESLNEITAFITNGGGLSCGTASATGNSVPVVTAAGTSFTIPASTPFELTASATDANGDSLTYLWEQYDRNNLSSPSTFGWDDGVSPLFRSYSP
ncbi:MAG: reprolysin-like metallopeptidase, partial [Vicinamibacterales bacterium]